MDQERLNALLDETADQRFKGLSGQVLGRTLREILASRPSLFDGTFSPPVMALRQSALEQDLDTMASYCAERGVLLAPHGKTTLAPQLFARQLERGAWGITLATPSQVMLARSFGVSHVLMANELADPVAATWVLEQLRADDEFEFLCYVDSVAGVKLLAEVFAQQGDGRGFDVLVEMGPVGGRTGCRTVDAAVEVARAAAAVPGVRVVGVAGYEGGIGHDLVSSVFERVRAFLGLMRTTTERLLVDDLLGVREGKVLLSAGGSVFFDDVVDVLAPPLADGTPVQCVIRAGSYVTHDSGLYAEISPFTREGANPKWRLAPAIEVWGQVLSAPEPGLALVGMGKRDAAFDEGLPIPSRLRSRSTGEWVDASSLKVTSLNDQHAFVAVPDGFTVEFGDWLMSGISHPCTQFDKWHLIPVVDDDYIVVDFIRTFF